MIFQRFHKLSFRPILQYNHIFKALSSSGNLVSNVKEQKISLKNQTINYAVAGHGSKALLCCPGALGTIWTDFMPQIRDLGNEKFTVVAWDPPGYGDSRPPERNFSIKFYENDADSAFDLMTHLGIHKFSLLGWSDGGISSMILAAKYPTTVEKLVIWGANAYVTDEEVQGYEKIRDVSEWSEKMRAPLIKLYTEAGLQRMWNQWCDTMNQLYVSKGGDICKEALSQIKCPTLILHGDKDSMVADEHPPYLVSNIKGSKLHRFPQGKHNIHLRYADQFNSVITNFLSESP